MHTKTSRYALVVLFLLAGLTWGFRAPPTGDEHENLDKLPDTKLNIKCPSGHSEIKVISGDRAFPTKDGILPNELNICARCLYVYDEKKNFWEREGKDVNDFSVALTNIIKNLPFPEKIQFSRELSYNQYWKEDGARQEYVVCRSYESYPAVAQRIKDYLKKNGVDMSRAKETTQRFDLNTLWKDYELTVEVASVEQYKDIYVRIRISTLGSVWYTATQLTPRQRHILQCQDIATSLIDNIHVISLSVLGIIVLAFIYLRRKRNADQAPEQPTPTPLQK